MDTQTLELLDRRCTKRDFPVPRGWRRKVSGAARRGDRWWRWTDESWQSVGEHAFLGNCVTTLQAVIERIPGEG